MTGLATEVSAPAPAPAPIAARSARNEERRCALVARARGEDPIGMAGRFERYVCIERPLPWPKELWRPADLPAWLAPLSRVPELVQRATESGVGSRALAIAPDGAYSRDGHTTILVFQRPRGPFATFERHEYAVPHAQLDAVLDRAFATHQPAGGPPDLDAFRVAWPVPPRDLMVCTHGTVDGCCAHLGYPAYRTLRQDLAPAQDTPLRVWRVSHFGGHRLAPTLVDWPEGRWWGFLGPETLPALARRDGPPAALRGCYRGWGGLGFYGQLAEPELLTAHGWEWTAHRISEQLLEVDGVPVAQLPAEPPSHPQFGSAAPQTALVRLTATSPDGVTRVYDARLERIGTVPLLGECGPSNGAHGAHAAHATPTEGRGVAQYRVLITL